MKKNVGVSDKIIRFIIGSGLIAAGYYYQIWWLVLIGWVSIFTATFSFCGLYTVLGINTCKIDKK